MFGHLLTALFFAALLVSNVLAVVEYNVTMRSTAAILAYEPFNTTSDAGWNETYSLASWGEYNTGAMPDGDNAHVTSHIGATVSVSWVGTGVYFHGSGQVSIQVDDNETYSGPMDVGGVGVGGLPYTSHNAILSVTEGTVSVTNVTLTTIIGGDGAVDIEKDIGSLNDTGINPDLGVMGRWTPSWRICGDMENATMSSSSCSQYDTLITEQVSASVSMPVPINASIAMVSGAVGSDYGSYAVILDPAPPRGLANYSGNAKRAWISPGNVLYFGSLDPAQRYTLRIQYTGGGKLQWGLARFIVAQGGAAWSPPGGGLKGGDGNGTETGTGTGTGTDTGAGHAGSKSDKPFPIGPVVGGIVGGLAVILLIAGLIWWRKRKRQDHSYSGEKVSVGKKWRRRHSSISHFDIDVVDQTNQSGQVRTYHPADPFMTDENHITPLPVPWPGDLVSPTASGSGSGGGKGSYPSSAYAAGGGSGSGMGSYPSSAYTTQSYTAQSHGGQTFDVGSVYNSNISQPPTHSYPPKSPFTDAAAAPAAAPLSPVTPIQMYPPSPAKGPALLPPRPSVVTQAEDGGRVVEEQVPPRYNPAWADDGPGGGRAGGR
ncbi:hypothetical protein CcaverHIS002_0301610 [Cutaneotrichosporon cavernicola]|uniref:Mid2 domain-containing protein n=1 Tax=Cutaneotrichosporon cavernicola TaxID=279322 RepID=A0AA48I2U9_9TREE|nr:uncharacterized protein CcaverHIS019_0301560 [Cutaneotrichosporon cavernicola]BEI82293.1 hypothetical protein CcaverHIS002_0301610 [Cutaneotrichosporon cavernicola]BEI90086.1 hypothetical protein CcaverHIS019_0301560 [Cutaneotrichosporon cavernicola]BEI97863.1 hypothetical protein CcaverHIS631_0301620 [Cutaneotrichosporon cavernicola]BEJ05641.1 hypothetical protein CcaverHIS641_0301630 [Cutaneotrichosporon cavernicola]